MVLLGKSILKLGGCLGIGEDAHEAVHVGYVHAAQDHAFGFEDFHGRGSWLKVRPRTGLSKPVERHSM